MSDVTAGDLAASNRRAAASYIGPRQDFISIGRDVTAIAFTHPGYKRWWLAFLGAMGLLGVLALVLFFLLYDGVGIWGNNIPVTWALDIVGYDWWMGVACGALFISSVLLFSEAPARSALNRITQTAALVAAVAAGIYPIIHLGRPWFFYWNLPYPNTLLLWPQFRSPLYWDAVDIISFLGVALGSWYIGMLPDLATLRDRAFETALAGRRRGLPLFRAQVYGILALGWRGSAVHWRRWNASCRALALMGIFVVIALQTGAAVMFAGSVEPGWHDTMQPVSFIVGALLQGIATMAVLGVMLRAVFGLETLITRHHFELLAWLMLMLGLLFLYCYAQEFLVTALFGDSFDKQLAARRFGGSHAWSLWAIVIGAILPVQLFWSSAMRGSAAALVVVGLLVSFGLWADHFMVIVVTLQQDFLPSVAAPYHVAWSGLLTFVGSVGLFLALLLLFLRYFPVVSIMETRRLSALRVADDLAHGSVMAPAAVRGARRRG